VLTGRPATAEESRQFGQYLDLLMAWNRAQRLTGHRTPEAIAEALFEDSLLFLRLLPQGPLRLVDIGAGAGIPGLPLKIVRPEICLWLIDSKRKRVSFLAAVKRELGLRDVEIVEGRAEDLVKRMPELAGAFDIAVSRGVAPPQSLLPTAFGYLKPGGALLMTSGPHGVRGVTADPRLRSEAVRCPELGLTRAFVTATRPIGGTGSTG
jgi:16S rRNA (guanine527-N7)-methyltransferase